MNHMNCIGIDCCGGLVGSCNNLWEECLTMWVCGRWVFECRTVEVGVVVVVGYRDTMWMMMMHSMDLNYCCKMMLNDRDCHG